MILTIITITFAVLLFVSGVYVIACFWLHDYSLPQMRIDQFCDKKHVVTSILFIYPHPDDETMNVGGLINMLSRDKRFLVHTISLTKGEKGDELLKIAPKSLAKIREKEYASAVKRLEVGLSEIWDYPDGNCEQFEDRIRDQLLEYISENQISVIITYEKFGLYGHPDHMILSKIVREVGQENNSLKIWYGTLTQKIIKRIDLPYHMSKIGRAQQVLPEYRLNVSQGVWAKYRAMTAYKSQKLGRNRFLFLSIPFLSNEYFTRKFN